MRLYCRVAELLHLWAHSENTAWTTVWVDGLQREYSMDHCMGRWTITSLGLQQECSMDHCMGRWTTVWGAGIAQWLERRTRDLKVAGSNPCRRDGRIFFLQGQLSVVNVWYPFHPRVTAVARKRPRSFCQNCRWQLQLNTHAPYVCGFA